MVLFRCFNVEFKENVSFYIVLFCLYFCLFCFFFLKLIYYFFQLNVICILFFIIFYDLEDDDFIEDKFDENLDEIIVLFEK